MLSRMPVKANDMTKGMAIDMDGELFVVVDTFNRKPGKGGSYVRTKFKSLSTGLIREERFRPDEVLEDAFLERKPMQYLYKDNAGYVFMDLETYEQHIVSEDLVGDDAVYLTAELEVQVVMYEGKAVGVNLPSTVEMTVTETDPAIKGQTATNQYKPAMTDTGLSITVPPFVEVGEVIKVDTREGKYLSRA